MSTTPYTTKPTTPTTTTATKPSRLESAKTSARNGASKATKKVKDVFDNVTAGQVAAAAGVATAAAVAGVVAKKMANRSTCKIAVEPEGERWHVKVEGNQRPSKTFALKREAVDAGREMARKRVPSELVIFRSDGSEQQRHEYEA